MPATHWHAYSWTGHARPPDSERTNPENATPPLEIAHWLRKPARHIVATYDMDDGGRREAAVWLQAELKEYPRPRYDLSPQAQMDGARDCLERGADVVWGYYSEHNRYVSRALIACPRNGERCPTGHG